AARFARGPSAAAPRASRSRGFRGGPVSAAAWRADWRRGSGTAVGGGDSGRESSPKPSGPSTPIRPYRTLVPRRTLFHNVAKQGMVIFSFNKDWRQSFSGKALPYSVMIGLKIPWSDQSCRLCSIRLPSAKDAWKHIKNVHRSRRVLFLCTKCASYKNTLRQALTHAPKCKPRIKSRPRLMTPHKCGECSRIFSSVRGLSLHRRGAHLESYLHKPTAIPPHKRGNAQAVWTEPLLHILQSILDTCPSKRGCVKQAMEALPMFTKGQIIYRCRALRKNRYSPKDTPCPIGNDLDRAIEGLELEMDPVPTVSVVRKGLWLAFKSSDFKHVKPMPMTPFHIGKKVKTLTSILRRRNPKIVAKSKRSCLGTTGKTAPVHPRTMFKMRQEAAEKSMDTLAAEILDGRSGSQCEIDGKVIHMTYKGIWERADAFKTLGQFGKLPSVDNSHFACPITEHEVVKALKRLQQESAPGPDGLKKKDFQNWDPKGLKLARLFNTLMVYGIVPSVLKGSRTVLIPKSNDPTQLGQIKNWRPITIGPLLQRLFSGILTVCLSKACSIHPRQRGFIKASGCAENLLLLKGILELCKRERKSIAVVFIDFAKAFDTVSHAHIDAVLERRGLDELIRGIIKNSYKRCYSRIQTVEGPSKKIFLKVGVKQGDPTSPMLFNLALDPLLHKLDEMGKGYDIGNGSLISAMAYADDLVILSDSWEGMRTNLRILDKFAELTGLAINPGKCFSFLVHRGIPVVNAEAWTLRDQPIQVVGPSESVKYLGIKINPWKGFLKPRTREELRILLERISNAKVKPTVKLDLLRTFAIPRLFYAADFGMVGKTLLEDCDRDIRNEVRKWFHLHPTTTNGLLYSRYCDGGLGIPRLSTTIPAIQIKRQVNLLKTKDKVIRFVADSTIDKNSLCKSFKSLTGGDRSFNPDSIRMADLGKISSKALKSREFNKWRKFKLQGNGVAHFYDDKISNCWLRTPVETGFTQPEFILGLKLRSNSLPVRASAMFGGNSAVSKKCRLCHLEDETFKHVLSRCRKLKYIRMRRHNDICKLLGKVCRARGWNVLEEKRVTRRDGRIGTPDLILLKDKSAHVIDVAVPLETNDMGILARTALYKVTKYKKFRKAIKRLFPRISKVSVWGFPIGARGKWFEGNTALLRVLGVPNSSCKSIARCIIKLALWGTIKLCKGFRSVAPEL
uniref:ribonuclease H n=1 Tax=Sphaeramia orbicularis TaxID=375764 RepID=A0A673BF16_9TELE